MKSSPLKIDMGINVFTAAIERVNWIFQTFRSVCVSFSGGKDSTVLLHIVADIARKRNKKFSVLFVDWEAQYKCTIEHVCKMRYIYRD
ncbi:phosphoadenosine phosphosulfate reductase, partial [Salmonella enterica]|nr:phosphoadenosine phosphosulfate reductase [Salmonella enterica]